MRHRSNDHASGGPSVVSRESSRDTRKSQVSAPVNIPVVSAPDARVQPVMSCRKLEAPSNIPRASITCDISHWPMFWSKRAAPWNIPCTFVTCDISHWLMSTLNCVLPWNRKLMSVTRDTSQWGMVPSQNRSPTHASTAALSSALVVTSRVHTASVSTRSVHDVTPFSTYPGSHSGTHDVPLMRVSVQLPTAPLTGG